MLAKLLPLLLPPLNRLLLTLLLLLLLLRRLGVKPLIPLPQLIISLLDTFPPQLLHRQLLRSQLCKDSRRTCNVSTNIVCREQLSC
jgi:hypothetical protein